MSNVEALDGKELEKAREWFARIKDESDHVWLLRRNRNLRIVSAMLATIDILGQENDRLRSILGSAVASARKSSDGTRFMIEGGAWWLKEATDAIGGKPEETHVIDFRDNGWTIQHPLACRPDLFSCPVPRAATEQLIEAPDKLGRFTCWIDDEGTLQWDGSANLTGEPNA